MAEREKKLPSWLLGLILAVIVFALILVVLDVLGFGDDPVVESIGVWFGRDQ